MTYNMDFNFPYAHVLVKGLDTADFVRYSRSMEYEVPFEVRWTENNSFTFTAEEKRYIINPNLVTYVEITETKE